MTTPAETEKNVRGYKIKPGRAECGETGGGKCWCNSLALQDTRCMATPRACQKMDEGPSRAPLLKLAAELNAGIMKWPCQGSVRIHWESRLRAVSPGQRITGETLTVPFWWTVAVRGKHKRWTPSSLELQTQGDIQQNATIFVLHFSLRHQNVTICNDFPPPHIPWTFSTGNRSLITCKCSWNQQAQGSICTGSIRVPKTRKV